MNTFDITTCTDCAVIQMYNDGTGMSEDREAQVRAEWARTREVDATGGVAFSGYINHILFDLFDECEVCGEYMQMTNVFTCWT